MTEIQTKQMKNLKTDETIIRSISISFLLLFKYHMTHNNICTFKNIVGAQNTIKWLKDSRKSIARKKVVNLQKVKRFSRLDYCFEIKLLDITENIFNIFRCLLKWHPTSCHSPA